MENFGKMAVFPGGYGRIGVHRVKDSYWGLQRDSRYSRFCYDY